MKLLRSRKCRPLQPFTLILINITIRGALRPSAAFDFGLRMAGNSSADGVSRVSGISAS
jgi:hypothetical protein